MKLSGDEAKLHMDNIKFNIAILHEVNINIMSCNLAYECIPVTLSTWFQKILENSV